MGLGCLPGDRLMLMESGKMGLLKKNGLAVLGWSVFAGLYYLFVKLFFAWLAQQIPTDSSIFQTKPLLVVAFIYLSSFVFGFSAFAISLRFIVFPIMQRETTVAVKLKYPLFSEWVIFFIVFMFLTLPIGLIEGLLGYFGLPDAITEMVQPAWQAGISLWFYRENVLTYFAVQNDQLEGVELQMQESA